MVALVLPFYENVYSLLWLPWKYRLALEFAVINLLWLFFKSLANKFCNKLSNLIKPWEKRSKQEIVEEKKLQTQQKLRSKPVLRIYLLLMRTRMMLKMQFMHQRERTQDHCSSITLTFKWTASSQILMKPLERGFWEETHPIYQCSPSSKSWKGFFFF